MEVGKNLKEEDGVDREAQEDSSQHQLVIHLLQRREHTRAHASKVHDEGDARLLPHGAQSPNVVDGHQPAGRDHRNGSHKQLMEKAEKKKKKKKKKKN